MKNLDSLTDLQNLRARAERRRLVTASLPPDAAPADMQRLVQELQVHQIELEMQYEELLLAQSDAEASRVQYLELYDFAPVGYCTLSAEGTLHQLNLRTSQLLGQVRQRLLGRRLSLFIDAADRGRFADFLTRLWAAPGERLTCEVAMRRGDNSVFFAQIEGVAASEGPDETQPPAYWRLVLLDVSERRRAADELAASEARFRATFEQSNDGMVLLEDHRFVDVNAAAMRLLGCTQATQMVGHPLSEFWPEFQPDGRRSMTVLTQCMERAQRHGWCRLEWQRLNAAGQPVWDEMSFNPVQVQGQPLLHAAWRDITERKRNEQQLQESEARLNMALSASETGVFTLDTATRQVYWDERSRAIFGGSFAPGPVPVQQLLARIHADDTARVWADLEQAFATQETLAADYRVVWPTGAVHHVSSAGRVVSGEVGQPPQFIGVLRDVTALYDAEADLHYKTLVLERLLNHMPMVLLRLRPDGSYLEMAGAGLRALGIKDNGLVGKNVFEVFPAMRGPMQQVLSGQPVEFVFEAEVQGQQVAFKDYGFFDEQRQQAVVLAVDITEAERQKRQLRAEKDFTQSLLENSIDGIVAIDTTGRVTAWNNQAAHYFGHAAAEAVGRPLFELLPHLDTDYARQLVGRVLGGEQVTWTSQSFTHREGHYDAYHVPLKPTDGAAPTGVLVIFRDVTERDRLTQEATRLELRQQQEVLSAILTTQEEERRRIAEALHNGLGQLLYGTRLHLDSLPPSEAVHASQQLLNEAIRTTRTISFELTPGILEDFGLVVALEELAKRIPPSQLRVDLNLHGLGDALPHMLEIAVYRIVQELLNNVMKHAQAQEVFVQVSREDEQLHISVEDDGVGFDPNQPVGRGGIGLSGIRTRVGLLGGTLDIQSHAGHGTGVFLALPVPAATAAG
ncbi:PAS domain S-box protein [Hymenobacter sp. HMF4947]|uniref:histidine kinase n=1 Tax=Hymenobacter ginkgonis TaxID=2682976 RepID=A0A7K1T8R9_9BACT|nr:PAS domain S-box protein [Hymenobacter ginkgonis]MVN74795.1 PAS domain S-box protein [Hymenobacter ginkgonis]